MRRHRLDGSASGPEDAARAVLGLHATEATSVVLSVLARASRATPGDVSDALYTRRTLLKWLAMRRTIFALPRDLVPTVQVGVSDQVATLLRKQLVNRLERNGSVPAIDGDLNRWIRQTEDAVLRRLRAEGGATGSQLGAWEPRLRTLIPARTGSEIPTNVTSYLLALMSADGQIVRGSAGSSWTSRVQRWEPVDHWFPDGLPRPDRAEAATAVARAWLRAFGPAPTSDLQWWTGWTKGAVTAALRPLPLVPVDLDGQPSVMLDDAEALAELELEPPPPSAALLPTLDPTPMGWHRREWFMGVPGDQLYDNRGNLGPTVWWNGEVIGGWGVTSAGEVRVALLADRGREAAGAVDRAAASIQDRIGGVGVTPSIRTPLERGLAEG